MLGIKIYNEEHKYKFHNNFNQANLLHNQSYLSHIIHLHLVIIKV